VATVSESLDGYAVVDCAITGFGYTSRVIFVAEELHSELETSEAVADSGKEHQSAIVVYKPEKAAEEAWAWHRFTGVSKLMAGSCTLPEPSAICVDRGGNVAVMRMGLARLGT